MKRPTKKAGRMIRTKQAPAPAPQPIAAVSAAKLSAKTAALMEAAARGEAEIVGVVSKDGKIRWVRFEKESKTIGWTLAESIGSMIHETTRDGKTARYALNA